MTGQSTLNKEIAGYIYLGRMITPDDNVAQKYPKIRLAWKWLNVKVILLVHPLTCEETINKSTNFNLFFRISEH